MKVKSEKQARAIVAKVAGTHVAKNIKQSEIKCLINCNIQTVGGKTIVQGGYYREITARGFVDAYRNLWTFGELLENAEEGAIFDKYNV